MLQYRVEGAPLKRSKSRFNNVKKALHNLKIAEDSCGGRDIACCFSFSLSAKYTIRAQDITFVINCSLVCVIVIRELFGLWGLCGNWIFIMICNY